MSMSPKAVDPARLDAGTMVTQMLRPLQQVLDQGGLQELTLNRAGEVFCQIGRAHV